MKTGFYYKVINFDKSRLVCISRTSPDWFPKEQSVQELMPSWNLLKLFREGKISEYQYCESYRQQLKKINAKELYKRITDTYGEDCVLLCWCGINDFCHRHLAAEWFEKELGVKVKEIGKVEYSRKEGRLIKKELQGELF